MEENPYSLLINNIRNDTSGQLPKTFRMGMVACKDPLKVEVAGTVQTADALLKNDNLEVFETGDKLLVMPIEDDQRFIIICKVVSI